LLVRPTTDIVGTTNDLLEVQMTTPFGPQLIGETEKTLNAILRRVLQGTGLSEPQWVTLRLASQLDEVDRQAFVIALTYRAHFTDSAQLVDQLTKRGLLEGGQLTAEGRDLIETVQTVIAETTAPIWHDLTTDDVVATERLLNEILRRSRHALANPQ
jgi:hypothetical protein